MNDEQLHELLYQTLETELGGVAIYETALRCVQNGELRDEFRKYHEQTTHHVELVEGLLRAFGLHPGTETPGRKVVRHFGDSLVAAMEMALKAGPPNAAELVAVECVTLAETKDRLNWELIGEVLTASTTSPDPRSGPLTRNSRCKRTNISATRPVGVESSGPKRSLGLPHSRPPRNKRTERPPSAACAPSRCTPR